MENEVKTPKDAEVNMVQVYTKVLPSQLRQVDRICKRDDDSRAKFIRRAIAQAIRADMEEQRSLKGQP